MNNGGGTVIHYTNLQLSKKGSRITFNVVPILMIVGYGLAFSTTKDMDTLQISYMTGT